MGTTITLSLISHTNVGKTTLARTLLRRDVGEVLDQAHVTDQNEAHLLIEADDNRLQLWDTPGFGDTARLMRRLRAESQPLVWFLQQRWDRVADRPLWCSQQGVMNMKEQADLVLYLVNAAEDPPAAGYVELELELLTWIEHPVLLLLNQVGDQTTGDLERIWREFVTPWPIVRDVLSLDAFTRCWPQEGTMLERVTGLLAKDQQPAMRALTAAWNARNLEVFAASRRRLATYLARAALDLEVAATDPTSAPTDRGTVRLLTDALKFNTVDKQRAMRALGQRLDVATRELMDDLIAAHGLAGSSAARIEQRDFQVKRRMPLNERSGALAGAIVSGALGGLVADVAIGFLSFGGGMIAGGILGALGGSALARGYRLVGGMEEPSVRWSPQFLDLLVRQAVLRYLAVAHFGRGRGDYRDLETQTDWRATVDSMLDRRQKKLHKLWTLAERSGSAAEERLTADLEEIVGDVARTVLRQAYPDARKLLK